MKLFLWALESAVGGARWSRFCQHLMTELSDGPCCILCGRFWPWQPRPDREADDASTS